MLEREYQYYLDSRNELLKKYDGRHLVIVGNSVVGAYESREQALDSAYAQYKPGTFLVQFCTPSERAESLHIHMAARSFPFRSRQRMTLTSRRRLRGDCVPLTVATQRGLWQNIRR